MIVLAAIIIIIISKNIIIIIMILVVIIIISINIMIMMEMRIPGLFYIIVEKWLVVVVGGGVGVHYITWSSRSWS